jgi:O-antigen chain-terminating methyltransferase
MSEDDAVIGLDEIVRRVKEEAAKRTRAALPSSEQAGSTVGPSADGRFVGLPRHRVPSDEVAIARSHDVEDFLDFDDEAFIRNAYAGVLRRAPDAVGAEGFRHGLRDERFSKLDVLARLRYSREGRAAGVRVRGLLPESIASAVRRVPVARSVARFAALALGLPRRVSRVERLQRETTARHGEMTRLGNDVARLAERALQTLHDRLSAAESESQQVPDLRAEISELRANTPRSQDLLEVRGWLSEVAGRISNLEATAGNLARSADLLELREWLGNIADRVANSETSARTDAARLQRLEQQGTDQRRELADQQRRLLRMMEKREQPELAAQGEPAPVVGERAHVLDAFYVAFEERFRGSRDDIKARVQVYVDRMREARAGTQDAPIIDLACGRGEWLEVLRDEGFVARGVDLNRVMLDVCLDHGLVVEEQDVLAYLRSLPDGFAGAITGFHIIEHLAFEDLVALLAEALRVLRQNGVAIFETPNPENILVGSCNFYYDPTHRNPLPPEVMRFVMEARGFGDVEVERLHPLGIPEIGDDDSFIAKLCTAPQDYAVLGRKS